MTDSNHPVPKPGPRPGPKPSALAPVPATEHRDRSAELAAATAFGRVDEAQTVFVRTAEGERPVGQYPDADAAGALEYFANKYLDLVDAAELLGQRLAAGAPADAIRRSAAAQREALAGADVVGDLAGLDERLQQLAARADTAAAAAQQETEARREEGRLRRREIVDEAERIAAQDSARVQWKQSGARMRELFARWKEVQAASPRLPRSEDQELWGRFAKARNGFDRRRKEFFAELDAHNAEGKRLKEKLVAQAEELSGSTDWRETAGRFRDLMDKWKATPRAGRKDDDALWARFRAAQDVFFAARKAENDAIDASYADNLVVKEALLERARALLPITDIDSTKQALRKIQDEWEDAGRVPRADISRMENGLREVESALSAAEDERWRKTNPETRARTSGVLSQLTDQLDELQAKLDAAEAAGDQKRIAKAGEELETKRKWYEQLARTAEEFSD
jgi:hypothetical protein